MGTQLSVHGLVLMAAVAGVVLIVWPAVAAGGGGAVWPLPVYPLAEAEQIPPVRDGGGLDAGPWAKAPTAGPLVSRGVPEPAERRTEVKMLTSRGVLHVVARCHDDRPDRIRADGQRINAVEDDYLELVIAAGGERMYPLLHVRVNAAGQCRAVREPVPQPIWRSVLAEPLDPAAIRVVAGIDKQGWWAAIELSVAALGLPAGEFRMNVARHWRTPQGPPAATAPAVGQASGLPKVGQASRLPSETTGTVAPPPAAPPPVPAGQAEPEAPQFAWGDLWGGPFLNAYRFGMVTPVKGPVPPVPALELPATLSVGVNRLKFAGWAEGFELLVDGRAAAVDGQGGARVRIEQHGPAALVVRDAGGAERARYACAVPRPLIVSAKEAFRADLVKPIAIELLLDLPTEAKADISLTATQDGKVIGRHRAALPAGRHAIDLAVDGAKAGEVRIEAAATAEVPAGDKPIQLRAEHWCTLGAEAAAADRFRDNIGKLPTAALLRAASADAGGYWRAVQDGGGLFGRRGVNDIWAQGEVYLIALLYKSKWAENPHCGDRRFLASAALGMEEALDPARWSVWMNEPDNRGLQAFLLTYELLKGDVPAEQAGRWKDLLTRIVERVVETWMVPADYRYTCYSADTGTGSNHWAYHAANVHTAGRVLGRNDWLEVGRRQMLRLAGHEKDGQFAERRGVPTPSYNRLTQTALAQYYFQSGDDGVKAAIERCAEYACRTYLFDGGPMTLHDGRVNGGHGPSYLLLPLSVTARGRALARTCALHFVDPSRPPSKTAGEGWFRLGEAAANFRDGPEADWAADGEFCYMDGLALVARRGGFQYGLSGLSLPPIESLFRLDPQNAVELAHARAGVILRGNNSQKQPEAGSFFSRPAGGEKVAGGRPGEGQAVWLPIDGLIQRTTGGHAVTLNFGSFRTRVTVRVLEEPKTDAAEMTVELIESRRSGEPVVYNFFPAADPKHGLDISPDARTLTFGDVTLQASAPVTVERDFKIFNPYTGRHEGTSKPFRAWVTLDKDRQFVLKVSVAKPRKG